MTRLTIALLLAMTLVACDREAARDVAAATGTKNASTPPVESTTLAQRLLNNLDARRQWHIHHVKMWLERPDFACVLNDETLDDPIIHAYRDNVNDFHAFMMRIDEGDTLYEISKAEFDEIGAMPPVSDMQDVALPIDLR